MKKVLTLLLILVVVFTLCACGSNGSGSLENNSDIENFFQNSDKKDSYTGEKTIVGKWTGKIDLGSIFAQYPDVDPFCNNSLIDEDESFQKTLLPDGIGVKVTFEFNEDGTAIMYRYLKSAIEDYKAQAINNMIAYYEELIEEEGLTKREAEIEMGMSIKEAAIMLVDIYVDDLEEDEKELVPQGSWEYQLEGNKLYLSRDREFEDYFKIDLDRSELTFKSYSGEDVGKAVFAGLTLDRK